MLVARSGFRIFEIGTMVEQEVGRDGFSVVRDLVPLALIDAQDYWEPRNLDRSDL